MRTAVLFKENCTVTIPKDILLQREGATVQQAANRQDIVRQRFPVFASVSDEVFGHATMERTKMDERTKTERRVDEEFKVDA